MGEIFIINTFKRLLVSERGCAFTHGLMTSVFFIVVLLPFQA